MYFRDFLNIEKAENLNKFIENNFDFFEPKEWGAKDLKNNYKKTSEVKIIKWRKMKEHLHDLEQLTMYCNAKEFGYDINYMFDESNCFYNVYSSENSSNYDWHDDGGDNPLIDMKLTVLLNISTVNYVGGFFELFLNKPLHIKQFDKTGCMLIFPTYLQHRVTPVIQGERNTLALWLEGPRFK
jgi:PKHD-type hydroxylase